MAIIEYQPGNATRYVIVSDDYVGGPEGDPIYVVGVVGDKTAEFQAGSYLAVKYVAEKLGLDEGDAIAVTPMVAHLIGGESEVEWPTCARCSCPVIPGRKICVSCEMVMNGG